MRPTRLLVTLSLSILAITALLFIIPSRSDHVNPAPAAAKNKSKLRALLSFHTPLFPPSAVISLTDDNSTFFLARPAAFGPALPGNGLSGQLWIGSGFGEDNLGRGGKAGGELGCSDVPGWDESLGNPEHAIRGGGAASMRFVVSEKNEEGDKRRSQSRHNAKSTGKDQAVDETDTGVSKNQQDDGTDDHLLPAAPNLDDEKPEVNKGNTKQHADIQSLQESAEIAGKVVLLSRGGCGFLEKVKWVQRRGGKALIVGDDVRGGPLVTMYARGDTSNITVPALFTSYTTAHLLSSLIPSGGALGKLPIHEGVRELGKGAAKLNKAKDKAMDSDDTPTFTQRIDIAKPTSPPKGESTSEDVRGSDRQDELKSRRSWFRRLISWIGFGGGDDAGVSRRPPNSGRLGYALVEEFEDEKTLSAPTRKGDSEEAKTDSDVDGFVIGVHDWRDPDLMPTKPTYDIKVKPRKAGKNDAKEISREERHLGGGIITPGSGEYEKPSSVASPQVNGKVDKGAEVATPKQGEGWLSRLPWRHDEDEKDIIAHESTQCPGDKCTANSPSKPKAGTKEDEEDQPKHDGLWVTLTPTNMSSSPFFDTLLVLVISPLVTLTVVYALLLLRSRIRRRRWRAPKSVVERLPVRTYHTIASEASTTSIATPNSSSPSTPLLTPAPRRIPSRSSSRSRPRSRTTPDAPAVASSSLLAEHHESTSTVEKREAGLAEWRRRYGGRQKECVVCLEEYVDGVSRVMSLPCGHEFHAECITPWLTTRRRTCPICKGDVVRSLQRSTVSRQSSYEGRSSLSSDDEEEEVQVQAAISRNDSPTAALPMDERDLEQGVQAQLRGAEHSSWRDWAMNVWASLPTIRRREEIADRNR